MAAASASGTTALEFAAEHVRVGCPVDKTSSYMREEVDRWAAVIKSANIELQ